MYKKTCIIYLLLLFINSQSIYADEIINIPAQKHNNSIKKIVIKDESYDSYSGYDFTGKGKPRYYDPMYYGFFTDSPIYDQFINYPTFYMPYVRGKSK